jgi:hypothetical protein
VDENRFWEYVSRAHAAAGGRRDDEALDAQAEHLAAALTGQPPNELLDFQSLWDRFHAAAYRWDLWGAAYVINGGCSDDGFHYFRNWLIAQGRDVYTAALADPESLADLPGVEPDRAEDEAVAYAAADVYEELTGEEMPESAVEHAPEPAGDDDWDEDTVDEHFPRLAARFR